jgi:hypothetical protein
MSNYNLKSFGTEWKKFISLVIFTTLLKTDRKNEILEETCKHQECVLFIKTLLNFEINTKNNLSKLNKYLNHGT